MMETGVQDANGGLLSCVVDASVYTWNHTGQNQQERGSSQYRCGLCVYKEKTK